MRHCWRLNCGILRILAVPSHETATSGSWTRMSVGLHSVLAETSWWVERLYCFSISLSVAD